jgi:hypothetical protein
LTSIGVRARWASASGAVVAAKAISPPAIFRTASLAATASTAGVSGNDMQGL